MRSIIIACILLVMFCCIQSQRLLCKADEGFVHKPYGGPGGHGEVEERPQHAQSEEYGGGEEEQSEGQGEQERGQDGSGQIGQGQLRTAAQQPEQLALEPGVKDENGDGDGQSQQGQQSGKKQLGQGAFVPVGEQGNGVEDQQTVDGQQDQPRGGRAPKADAECKEKGAEAGLLFN